MKPKKTEENKFYYSYDPIIKSRVPFVLKGDYLISMVSDYKIKFDKVWVKEWK